MNSAMQMVDVYTDFSGFHALRKDVRGHSPEALEKVAAQFESIFIQMVLKSMRDANVGEGLFDNDQSDFYQEMFDQQLSVTLAGGKGLGLKEIIVRQIGGDVQEQTSKAEKGAENMLSVARLRSRLSIDRQALGSTINRSTMAMAKDDAQFDSPKDFVNQLWNQASGISHKLGVATEAILAQAALETGWGKNIIKHQDGSSSHNLFGIKADSRWSGERVMTPTIEYVDGFAYKRKEAFRSYQSFTDSLNDFADFLQSNPRYQQALRVGNEPHAFAHELQKAGYATDPKYSEKMSKILDSAAFQTRIAELKDIDFPPLS